MARTIGSIVAGYLAMAALIFLLFSAAWLVLGVEGSFLPDSWTPATIWISVSIVVGLVASMAGGALCMAIAQDVRGPRWLVVVVVVLGLLMAIPAFTVPVGEPITRPETVSMMEAMSNARQPAWLAVINPLLGAIGVIVGAAFVPRRDA